MDNSDYGGMALTEYEVEKTDFLGCSKCGSTRIHILRPVDFIFYTLPVFHICPNCHTIKQVAVGEVAVHGELALPSGESKIDIQKGGDHEHHEG